LEDFHVEYDDENPNYRKVTAVFKKNDTFKNETLVKEYLLDPEGDGSVISKSSIEYHKNKVIFFF
jgi:template-activating factor I